MMARGHPLEVLRIFFVLGLTSFGGPVAHLGYFRRAFVERLAWLDAEEYAGLLALCQFLPGPASSQVGFAIGLRRAGWAGGFAAWIGFTLPSAVLMTALALKLPALSAHPVWRAALHGLGLAAVAIVAQAVWQLSRQLCPDTPRRIIALLAAALSLALPGTFGQLFAIAMGGVAGRLRSAPPIKPSMPVPAGGRHDASIACLLLFASLLILSCLVPVGGFLGMVAGFYRTGALVFGGGHVVLPLLRNAFVTPGLIGAGRFLDGYGAAQAMPGPLFAVAAFYGACILGTWQAALGATVAIFLPGLLLVAAALPHWDRLRANADLRDALTGVNAAVVGLLLAAFINLLTLSARSRPLDLPIALVALALLTIAQARPILVVVVCALLSAVTLT